MHITRTNDYTIQVFGGKIYKIALDGGFTCPNRDGTKGYGGCIFCSGQGSGDFAASVTADSVHDSIREGIRRIESKVRNVEGYIAYFQAFTNTYAPVARLRELFMAAVSEEEVVALSIATRPDCLGEEVLELLKELNSIKPIWVELGLQTIHPATAEYIRRGYDLEEYDTAVINLKKIGIPHVITHVIIGLPGETEEMMSDTVRYVVRSGADGIKLQLLHVLKGTDLALDYADGKFDVLSLDEYIEILRKCLKLIPEGFVVHRLTGDGDKRELIAPLWSGDKKKVINSINKMINETGSNFLFHKKKDEEQ
ncbi:MAG: TIGR01212 family radical SAM protein [Lachnospiraceae bacterium]|nr:TIGR01212 family radical SAM protein [Lachnospiraceae bacterium]